MANVTVPPPRYPDITAEQWARVEKEVTLLVASKVGTNLGDPKDIAAEAIRRAQEPTASEWDRSKKTLTRHVGSFANSLMANGFRKLAFKSTDAVDPSSFDQMRDSAVAPDEAYTEHEARDIASARLRRIRELVEDDGCCVILLDAVARGEKNSYPSPRNHYVLCNFKGLAWPVVAPGDPGLPPVAQVTGHMEATEVATLPLVLGVTLPLFGCSGSPGPSDLGTFHSDQDAGVFPYGSGSAYPYDGVDPNETFACGVVIGTSCTEEDENRYALGSTTGAALCASQCEAAYIDTPPVCDGVVDGSVINHGLYWFYTVGPFTKEVCVDAGPPAYRHCSEDPVVAPPGLLPCAEQ